ncbi:hypothetical protein [Actinomadura sp.]|jgi:hypothetical protein|uniref:hypothetical protein n=1 Tax=Actinomadura sp. TaxID=1989 RepID=UPI00334C4AFA
MTVYGRVSWPPEAPKWTFLWELVDGDTEAIAFRDVYFKGIKVLHKASLPMIRVHYDSGAGPYKDQLGIGNMRVPVKVYEHVQSGHRHLVVESYHVISRYHIVNRWFFRDDGLIQPQLHSAGLQHNATHQHHVYWRFDFDIGGASNNLPLEHDPGQTTNWGYGPGWRPIRGEEAFWFWNRSWAVINKQSGLGYLLNRGEFDGKSDSFGRIEGAAVAYRASEDLKGRLGSRFDDEIYQHVTGESVDGKDVVLWYVAHLQHIYHGPEFEWHVCGPLLWPLRY